MLAPLGQKGDEVTSYIIEFVEHMNVGVLGSVGLALLLYTALSLMQKIEESFNFIWHIAQPRSLGERFSRYLSVLLVGPDPGVLGSGHDRHGDEHRDRCATAGCRALWAAGARASAG